MKICIDAGHGGTETGAVNKTAQEKNINLEVALKLKELLLHNGFEVVMTREKDETTALTSRCAISNSNRADLFISIHHNANDGKTNGYEVIYSINKGIGKELAQHIGNSFQDIGQKPNSLGIHYRESLTNPGRNYYYVIEHTTAPSIITEFCYLDSTDYSHIDNTQKRIDEAYALAKAICKFYKIEFKDVPSPHWAEAIYTELISNGIKINEKRFDDKITRGEVMALMLQIIKSKR